MATFRLFTNDRGSERGIPMYSALKEVEAANAEDARKQCPPAFDEPNVAAAVAIHWPASTEAEKRWLEKHVGEGL